MYKSNDRILLTGVTVLFGIALSANDKKTNVILLFSAQHNADVMSWTGHPDVSTPNLYSMANGGVAFTMAYCQDTLSVPSRISLFAELYPRATGILDNTKVETYALKNVVSHQPYTALPEYLARHDASERGEGKSLLDFLI